MSDNLLKKFDNMPWWKSVNILRETAELHVDTLCDVLEIPLLQVTEKITEFPEIQSVRGNQTSESLGSAPVRQVSPAELVELVVLGPPLRAESAPQVFVTAPVVDAPSVVVEHVNLIP